MQAAIAFRQFVEALLVQICTGEEIMDEADKAMFDHFEEMLTIACSAHDQPMRCVLATAANDRLTARLQQLADTEHDHT